MPGKFYKSAEEIVKKQKEAQFRAYYERYAVPLRLFVPVQNAQSRVYGNHSGDAGGKPIDIFGIVTSDDFFPSSGANSGSFVEGYLYTQHKSVITGCIVEIVSGDNKARRYKIDTKESVGFTTEVFTRWKLVSMAGDNSP